MPIELARILLDYHKGEVEQHGILRPTSKGVVLRPPMERKLRLPSRFSRKKPQRRVQLGSMTVIRFPSQGAAEKANEF
ncbi:MAG: hypothetical protein V1644_03640, partial [Candidatus Micrarchaeota archaeon]